MGKQTRGAVRNNKKGLLTEKELAKVTQLQKLGLDYLEEELRILTASPGNYKEVAAIVRTLEFIRSSGPEQAPAPTARDGFALDLD